MLVARHDRLVVTVSAREPSLIRSQRRLSRRAAGQAPGLIRRGSHRPEDSAARAARSRSGARSQLATARIGLRKYLVGRYAIEVAACFVFLRKIVARHFENAIDKAHFDGVAGQFGNEIGTPTIAASLRSILHSKRDGQNLALISIPGNSDRDKAPSAWYAKARPARLVM